MTVPVRRPRSADRAAFSMRQTILWFALAGAVLCGCGLMLRSLVRAAGVGGALGGVALAGTLFALLGLRRAGGRRRAATSTGSIPYETGVPQPVTESALPEAGEGREAARDFAAMDAEAFELAVAALCERDGCTDVEAVGGSGDLGADVRAVAPDGRRLVIQCKRYGPVNKVGSQDMQRFGGTCFAVHEADIAAVVTTGEFTGPAAEYAEQCGIVCLDRAALAAWADGSSPAPWHGGTVRRGR
ncbi:restriction endonuclease [Streptomyces spongiicola]|uniref:Restriction endonuclease n=1 Tax=Streptomyces spongiicola TaxID=1690221 RepID=A0ABN5KWP6_9ACTN|nr:restriction endonuclease [Streptomyces spongiicola]AWK12519.1 restriction endonuclease [Streptomyces spongiicola]